MIKELWHGNIVPQGDSRNNSPEMKQLMEYIARHHDDILKTMTDEQKRKTYQKDIRSKTFCHSAHAIGKGNLSYCYVQPYNDISL